MKALLGNSSVPNYIKLSAVFILVTTYLAALGAVGYDLLRYGNFAAVPAVVWVVLGGGIGFSQQVLGLHQGASLPTTPPPAI